MDPIRQLQSGRGPVRLRAAGLQSARELNGQWHTEGDTWLWQGTFEVSEPILLEWNIPMVDVAGKWHSAIGADRSLTADWTGWLESYATRNAPVLCLFSDDGRNRLTFALAEAVQPSRLQAQVDEENASIRCRVVVGDFPGASHRKEIALRVDSRDVNFEVALRDVAQWWADMPKYTSASVPPAAWEPVYSTWYAFHQNLEATEIESECALAAEMGFGSVIVDDGWQCDDRNKGYDFCGDWDIAPSKFPDFPSHVRRVHSLGLKYLLWFSAPFVGPKSRAGQIFLDRVLVKPTRNAACLDPRFPGVRDHLQTCWERAVKEWGIDGIKLDFVDEFTAETEGASAAEKADRTSVPEATDILLAEAIEQLRTHRPEVMIEFRQRYTGPAMRKYGNMLRAADCPGDALSNRVRTIDLRLLAGGTPVHSDMVMWHTSETCVGVALQLWATLFSVPQISMPLRRLSREHRATLQFYLDFWREHRNLVLTATLSPALPHHLYPLVQVRDGTTELTAVYSAHVAPILAEAESQAVVVNATKSDRLIVDLKSVCATAEIQDCLGNRKKVSPPGDTGPTSLPVPSGGLLRLHRNQMTCGM